MREVSVKLSGHGIGFAHILSLLMSFAYDVWEQAVGHTTSAFRQPTRINSTQFHIRNRMGVVNDPEERHESDKHRPDGDNQQ